MAQDPPAGRVREVIGPFFRLGCLGFGGPVAMMAMMEDEFQVRRQWITPTQYAEMLTITKMLPGPVATQLAIFIGKTRAGVLGGLFAGLVYVFPSFFLVLVLSYLYQRGGQVRGVEAGLLGLQIGALVVIFLSVWSMSKPYRESVRAWILVAASSVAIGFFPRWEPLIILGAGIFGALLVTAGKKNSTLHGFALPGLAFLRSSIWGAVGKLGVSPTLFRLFWSCFKAGALVFGTGLAVVPMLEGDAVTHYGWLTHQQFMDGLAMGQITPGPVVITATFIGYLTLGLKGAGVATLGMFLPSFINVLFLVSIFWKRWSGTPSAAGFSAWSLPVVIGGILGTTARLSYQTLELRWEIVLFVVVFAAAVRFRTQAWLTILVSGFAALGVGLFR